jgi:3-oxoacyl-[acyl-carrier protein] reductase
MTDLRFDRKTVLVTGGAGGFGSQTCRAFGERGANVVVADLNLEKAQEVAGEIGSAVAIKMDVTDSASIEAGIQSAVDTYGSLDILVNNAGAPNRSGPIEDTSVNDMDWLYQINYRSAVIASQAALPHLRASDIGNSVNVASISAKRPRPGHAVYCSIKAGVEALTRALAVELAPQIRVNSVSPVISETGFVKNATGQDKLTDEARTSMVAGIPMGRTAETQDVANAIVYLASEMASFQTGVCLDVDGGRSIS